MCYFFKKIKKLVAVYFEKNNLLCKKREKNNLSGGKIPAPLNIKWSLIHRARVKHIDSYSSFIMSTCNPIKYDVINVTSLCTK